MALLTRAMQPIPNLEMVLYSQIVPFGPTILNATLARFENCTSGGPLDICSICAVLHCDLNPHLNTAWLNENPRFTAIRCVRAIWVLLFISSRTLSPASPTRTLATRHCW